MLKKYYTSNYVLKHYVEVIKKVVFKNNKSYYNIIPFSITVNFFKTKLKNRLKKFIKKISLYKNFRKFLIHFKL